MTALLCLSFSIPSYSVQLNLKKGDFIQGEFSTQSKNALDLKVNFPDQSSRFLAQNIMGSSQFIFLAESGGSANFQVTESESGKVSHHYQIRIDQQIPLEKQTSLPEAYLSPTIQTLADKLGTADQNQANRLIETFWQKMTAQGTPLIETSSTPKHRLVTFLWRGAKNNVILWGGPTADHTLLTKLLNSDIWFVTFDILDDTFLSYRLAPDVPVLPLNKREQRRALLATLQRDPLNKRTYPSFIDDKSAVKKTDKFNLNSVLQLPNAPKSSYLHAQTTRTGQLQSYDFHSKLLNNSRRVFLYTPANFEPIKESFNLLFFFDGADYLEKVPTPKILDNMQAAGKLSPTIAVFIDNPSSQTRAEELPPNSLFAQMLAEELYPWVKQQLRINLSKKRTALIGSSYGGLAAAYAAMEYPHYFGNVIAMSGSFWWKPPESPAEQNNGIAYQFAKTVKLPLKFFISAGRYETVGGEESILANSRQLKDTLIAKEYEITYREYASGHDYFAWQFILSDALQTIFEQ